MRELDFQQWAEEGFRFADFLLGALHEYAHCGVMEVGIDRSKQLMTKWVGIVSDKTLRLNSEFIVAHKLISLSRQMPTTGSLLTPIEDPEVPVTPHLGGIALIGHAVALSELKGVHDVLVSALTIYHLDIGRIHLHHVGEAGSRHEFDEQVISWVEEGREVYASMVQDPPHLRAYTPEFDKVGRVSYWKEAQHHLTSSGPKTGTVHFDVVVEQPAQLKGFLRDSLEGVTGFRLVAFETVPSGSPEWVIWMNADSSRHGIQALGVMARTKANAWWGKAPGVLADQWPVDL